MWERVFSNFLSGGAQGLLLGNPVGLKPQPLGNQSPSLAAHALAPATSSSACFSGTWDSPFLVESLTLHVKECHVAFQGVCYRGWKSHFTGCCVALSFLSTLSFSFFFRACWLVILCDRWFKELILVWDKANFWNYTLCKLTCVWFECWLLRFSDSHVASKG